MLDQTTSRDVSLEELRDCGWSAILYDLNDPGYAAMHFALKEAAEVDTTDRNAEHRNALEFLAAICSMMLCPERPSDPFQPFFSFASGLRSKVPSDLAPSERDTLKRFLDHVELPRLRGRIAHILWLLGNPREPSLWKIAFESYRLVPITWEEWIRDGREVWTQVAKWVNLTGLGSPETRIEAETQLTDAALAQEARPGLIRQIAQLLRAEKLGMDHLTEIADRLIDHGNSRMDEGKPLDASPLFEEARLCYRTTGSEGLHLAAVREAEAYESEAERRASERDPSAMAEVHWYEQALRVLREIPRTDRELVGANSQIERIEALHEKAREQSVSQFSEVSTSGINLSATVESVRASVSGQQPMEALSRFASVISQPDVDKLRAEAVNRLREPSISAILTRTYVSQDGRATGRRPGINLTDTTADDDLQVWAEMTFSYQLHVGLYQILLLSALDVLHIEHHFLERDFVALAHQSPIVPPARQLQFGKALYLGYQRDYLAAMPMLIPQLEHMLRWSLAQRGAKVTSMSSEGLETYKSLERLLKSDASKQLLGESLHFELRALLCDPMHDGLRNEFAHGLLNDDQMAGSFSPYVWGLSLKLVLNAWHVLKDEQ